MSPRARRVMRALLGGVVAPIVLGAIVVLVLANTRWGNERVRRVLVSQANQRINGNLAIGSLRGGLLSHATLRDVRVLDSARHPLFTARRVRVDYALLSALRGHVVIRSAELDTAVAVLDKPPGGRWNFQSLMKTTATPADTTRRAAPPEIANVRVVHGTMIYRRPWKPDSTLPADKRDAAIAAALGTTARSRTEHVPGGYQRVLEYRDIVASIPVVRLAHAGQPLQVQVASLSMLAMPYRPPAADVRSLVITIQATKDSLWWRGAHMVMPASRVSGDGTIRFRKGGFRLDLAGAPIALADMRWMDPTLPANGGGSLRLAMRLHGDTSEYRLADADLRYRQATIAGHAMVTRIHHTGEKASLSLRDADVTVARLTTAALREIAPGVKLRRSGTIDGHVVLNGAPANLQLRGDVRFADVSAGVSHLIANGSVGMDRGFQARGLAVRMLPLQLATLSGAGVKVPVGGTLNGNATVTGSSTTGWDVRGDISHAQGTERSRIVGNGRYQVAGKRIAADATLEPLSLATVGRFVPSAGLRGAVTGRIHAEGTTRDLQLSGVVRSTTGGGSLDGRGRVNLAGDRSRYDVSVALDALDAHAFSTRAPSTALTGRVVARGTGTKPATANAVLSADLVRSRYDTFAVDRLRARLGAERGLLRVDTLDVTASGARARAAGSIGLIASRAGSLSFDVAVDSLRALRRWIGSSDTTTVGASSAQQSARLASARADSARRAEAVRIERIALGLPEGVELLPDTLPGIRRDSLGGSFHAAGTLGGSVQALSLNARAEGRDLVARGYAARWLNVVASSPNVRAKHRSVVFRGEAAGVQAAGYGFDSLFASGNLAGQQLNAAVRVRQDSLVSYAALGSYSHPEPGVHNVRLDSLAARFDTVTWRLEHPGGVRLAHGDVRVDSIDIRSSAGAAMFANGAVPKEGPVRLDAAASHVPLATVFAALQRSAVADGLAGFRLSLRGTRGAPEATGEIVVDSIRSQGSFTRQAVASIRYSNHRLTLTARAVDSTDRFVLAGNAVLPLDLALEPVHGSRKLPGELSADVVLDSLSLASLPLTSRQLEDIRGMLAADVHVRGSWARPLYSGRGALRGGSITVKDIGFRLTNALADLRLAGDTLQLDSLVATSKGTVRAFGSVSLADRAHPFVDLRAEASDLRVFNTKRGLVDVDGSVVAVGPLDSVRVTGRAEMLGGFLALKQFNKNLLRVKSPGTLSFFSVFDSTTPAAELARVAAVRAKPHRIGLIADLSVSVDRGNYYRNRPDANTEFYTGPGEELRAHIDTREGERWAVGFVRVGDGVEIFRTRPFTPARGTLTFGAVTNGPGYVQQLGEREIWEPGRGLFPLHLMTGATSKSPAIGLESGTLFPMRGRELNGYLTIGRDYTSLLQQSGSSLSGSEAWSGQLSGETGALARRQQAATALGVVLHDLGTGTTKEFGLDAFGIAPADVPTELVFGKTGGVRGAMMEGGRYLTVDSYLAGQLRLTTGYPGARLAQRLGESYRFDVGFEPRFLFRGPEELGITHPTVRTGVFGAFLTRLWNW